MISKIIINTIIIVLYMYPISVGILLFLVWLSLKKRLLVLHTQKEK